MRPVLPLNLTEDRIVEVEVADKADQALHDKVAAVRGFAGVTTRDGKNYVLLDETARLSSLDALAELVTPPEVKDAT